MGSQLREAVMRRDAGAVEQCISALQGTDNWSLVSVLDELTPFALMESNLQFGSFHSVKMTLFLRRLAMEGYFSKPTELALARLIARELVDREWVLVQGDRSGYVERDVDAPVEKVIEALDRGNVHNAFFYASGAMARDKAALVQALLSLGASAIPHSLGHSLTCFFPVMEDLLYLDHAHADSALLTYLMYLVRYEVNSDVLKEGYGALEGPLDYGALLKRCASGIGIVDIHHMITFYVATAWEGAAFNAKGAVPCRILLDWVGDKPVDEASEERVANAQYAGKLADTYEEFQQGFSFEKLDASIPYLFALLANRPKRTVDWLFRLYASYYAPDSWDPHYYTGLYSALRLYMGDKVQDPVACRMAVAQALAYFAEDVT